MTAEPSQMRADARENRARVLAVARELFAQRGLDVPMTAIARRAGVGVATLYRRFPTKESLVLEAFTEQFTVCQAVIDEALTDPDPWRGFCAVIEKVCLLRADFSPHDLTLVLMANGGLAGVPVEVAVAASRRLVAYLLEAFRVGTGALPPPVPLSLDLVLR